jgi:DNA-binding NtrC family response regulator
MTTRILVVDDEPDVADLVRQNFRGEIRGGVYSFDFALSGEHALHVLRHGVPPKVVMVHSDINMPGMTGIALLETIRREWPVIRLCMITAYGCGHRGPRARDRCRCFPHKAGRLRAPAPAARRDARRTIINVARILVVDDELDVEALVTQRFRRRVRAGEIELRFAQDGQQALEMLDADPDVDIVLADINMPRMDGLALLLRLDELAFDLKTVIVSAYGDMRNIRTAMNRGAFDFVTKPIEFDDLEATLTRTLEHLSMLRRLRADKLAAERATAALSRYSRRTWSRRSAASRTA